MTFESFERIIWNKECVVGPVALPGHLVSRRLSSSELHPQEGSFDCMKIYIVLK